MKLPEGTKPKRGMRAPDVLRHEIPERVEFDPRVDISPEQKQAVIKLIQGYLTRRKWADYAEHFSDFQRLFPGELSLVSIPQHELDTEGLRDDLALKLLVNLLEVGQPNLELEANYKTAILGRFERDFTHAVNDPTRLLTAMEIIQLGWKKSEEVFSDREKAWKQVQADYEWCSTGDDYYFLAELFVGTKILFPERSQEIRPTSEQLQRMKRELRTMPIGAPIKILRYACALYFITADEIHIDEQGQIKAERKAHLSTSPALPTRPVM